MYTYIFTHVQGENVLQYQISKKLNEGKKGGKGSRDATVNAETTVYESGFLHARIITVHLQRDLFGKCCSGFKLFSQRLPLYSKAAGSMCLSAGTQ